LYVILHVLYLINGWDNMAVELSMNRNWLDVNGKLRVWMIYCILKGKFFEPFGRDGSQFLL